MLDVVEWICQEWDDLHPLTLVWSWRKLLDHEVSQFSESIDKQDSNIYCVELAILMGEIPGCEGALVDGVEEWMKQDKESDRLQMEKSLQI